MSNYSDIVKQGYLKAKSQKLGKWQKRWVVLRCASSRGPNRLERFENEKKAMLSDDPKVINLTEVERVEQAHAENRLYVLTLVFNKSHTKKFAADSDMEASEWFEVLNQHIGVSVPTLPLASNFGSGQPDPRDMFHVYLLPNTNTQFCGEYLLQVTASSIILYEPNGTMKPLIMWKLNTLRSYGRDDSKFTFEAGRLAETGEGLFIFTTVEAEQVYQKVNSATQALVTVQSMNRRQQGGLLSDRGVPPDAHPIARHNSDSGSKPNAYLKNQPVTQSKSLPVSPIRDSNANTMLGQLEQNGASFSGELNADYNSRPLPAPPRQGQNINNLTYIDEECSLSPGLRQFLSKKNT